MSSQCNEIHFTRQGEATGRAIKLAAWVGVPLYVVHVMSQDALHEVARARTGGQRVVGEAVASALALTDRGLCALRPPFAATRAYRSLHCIGQLLQFGGKRRVQSSDNEGALRRNS